MPSSPPHIFSSTCMKKRTLLFTSTLLLGIGSLTFFQTRGPDEGLAKTERESVATPESESADVSSPEFGPTRNQEEQLAVHDVSELRPIEARTWGAENVSGYDLDNIPFGVQRVDEVLFEKIGEADERGLVRRSRVLKTDFHFPKVQTVELLETDQATGEQRIVGYKAMVADHVMVQVDLENGPADWEQQLARKGIGLRRAITKDGLYIMDFDLDRADGAFQVIDSLRAEGDWVRFAEPDMLIAKLDEEDEEIFPNDPMFEDLWGLHNTGQTGTPEFIVPEFFLDLVPDLEELTGVDGIPGFDINAVEGWQIRTDAPNVVVAVLDTGIDFDHPDLKANMWVNPQEEPDNRDNSGNGFVDDIYGVDLVTGGAPMDFDGHGTHVAGTIGAIGNNQDGVVGVAWDVELMSVKILSPGGTLSDVVRGIDYAWENGAHILNNSWGILLYGSRLFDTWRSQSLADAILRTQNAGAIFVTAAGNDADDVDIFPDFPADHQAQADNVVNVAAYDRRGLLAEFSNYGVRNVHIAAPGHQILSTWPGNTYNTISGTSMAAPHVAGVLALLKAEFPNEPYDVLIQRLYQRSQKDSYMAEFVEGGRMVDLGAALDPSPLVYAPVADTFFMPNSGETVTLTVGASGKGATSYQWYLNDQEIAGAEDSTYEITNPGASAAGVYRVEVSNDHGTVSSEATLRASVGNADLAEALKKEGDDSKLNWFTSDDAPWTSVDLEDGPAARSASITHNENTEVRTSVAGPGKLTFSMKASSEQNRDELVFMIGDEVQGSASGDFGWYHREYTLPEGDHELIWRYSKDGGGSVGEDAAWLRNVTYEPHHPVIDSVSGPGQLEAGSDMTLSVDARGNSLVYVWWKDGELLSGENSSTLERSSIGSADGGTYMVRVQNSDGYVSRTMEVGIVSQASAPTIFHHPQSVSGGEGDPVVLWADFEATSPWGIQWYKNGEPISGATENYLNLGGIKSENVGSYSYRVTNAAGSDESLPALVSLAAPIETYNDWLSRFGGIEAVEQASGDGVDPLLRFALGVSPDESLIGHLPQAAMVPGSDFALGGTSTTSPEGSPGGDYMALVFERPSGIEGVAYVLEASVDLKEWKKVESMVEIHELSGADRQLVQLREANPLPEGDERRFLRMRVELEE